MVYPHIRYQGPAHPDQLPVDCSVDPITGNLAVSNVETAQGSQGSVSIYTDAKGSPTMYTDPDIAEVYFLGYDNRGNLFLDGVPDTAAGFLFAELRKGAGTFTNITLNQNIETPGGVLWDGTHVAVGDSHNPVMYRFTISGSTGTKVGSTPITGFNGVNQFWKEGTRVVVIEASAGSGFGVGFWKYPAGGRAIKILKLPKPRPPAIHEPSGAAISLSE